jgi:hypothetical protein
MKSALISAVFFLCVCGCDQSGGASAGSPISDVTVEVHPRVSTVLIVSWEQNTQTDGVWLRFTFENEEYFESPKKPGEIGDHLEVILGVPSETIVTFYIMNESGGTEVQ